MAIDKVAKMLHRRPPQGRLREQLFWLVDVIYACKSSGDTPLADQAQLCESALGRLGEYLETGEEGALHDAMASIEEFAGVVTKAVAGAEPKE